MEERYYGKLNSCLYGNRPQMVEDAAAGSHSVLLDFELNIFLSVNIIYNVVLHRDQTKNGCSGSAKGKRSIRLVI